jgi:hypothetical protein
VTDPFPTSSLQLRSPVVDQGMLELSLVDVAIPPVAVDEVLVRLEAAPINPSDLGPLLAGADVASAVVSGTTERLPCAAICTTNPIEDSNAKAQCTGRTRRATLEGAAWARVSRSRKIPRETAIPDTRPNAKALVRRPVPYATVGRKSQTRP